MKGLAHGGGVAVFEAGTLNEQDVDGFFDGINPALRAVGTAMAVGAGAQGGGGSGGRHDDLKAEPHAHALGKPSLEISGLILRHQSERLG